MCWAVCSYGQRTRIDSLLQALKKTTDIDRRTHLLYNVAFALANVNPDSAILTGKQAVQLAVDAKNDSDYQASNNALGWSYYRANKYDSAEACFTRAIVTCHKMKLSSAEGRIRLNMVSLFLVKKNYEKALAVALPVTGLFDAAKDNEGKAYTEKQIGIIYREMGQVEKAKAYLQAATNDFLAIGSMDYYMTTLPSLGGLYLKQKQYDSTLLYYRKALDYQQKNINVNTAFAWENMGDAFFAMAEDNLGSSYNDSALYHYTQARNFFAKTGDTADVAFEAINIGKCLARLKRYQEAIAYLTGALKIFGKDNQPDHAFEASLELSQAYSAIGNYKQAYQYLQESTEYKDSLEATNNNERIATMFAQYETDKKDRTIQLLNTQKALDNQEISRQHIITIFTISLIVLGACMVLILWNRRGIKQKLKEVQMRNQLSSDLHDDIGSSLSSILLLSNMAAQNDIDKQMAGQLLNKINNNAREVIDRMSDIVWSMNPRFDEGESLRERIENYVASLKELTSVAICVNIDNKIDQQHFTMELRKNIFLIIKEAINNALKYAGAAAIMLVLAVDDKNFVLTVQDDGKGFNKTETTPGNGFDTMVNRAKASYGTCEVTSAPGKGTLVKAIIPIPHIR